MHILTPHTGFVKYVDEDTARQSGLIHTNASTTGAVQWGVDSTNQTPNGRPSIRLESKKKYDTGLVVIDVAHMPFGCGTWPAFWMVGPDWPHGGEIDILEGVNEETHNGMTLHTAPGCQVGSDTSQFAGEVTTPNCDVQAPDQDKNVGCSIKSPSKASYGAGLNAAGGGVYATQWTDDAISVYFFPRDAVPDDVLGDSPDPAGWGIPAAKFAGGCDISRMFKQQQIVFNTAFCGDWAGNEWTTGSCKEKAPTCDEYVRDNPEAFAEAHWTINALKVYKDNGQAEEPIASAPPAPSSTAIGAPVPVPSSNTSLPISSSVDDTLPTPLPTLSFSSGSYVSPSGTAVPAIPIPTSESLITPSSQVAEPTAVPTLAPVQPAPVGSGGMPGFAWPAPSGSVGGGGSKPGNATQPQPPSTPDDDNEEAPIEEPEPTAAPVQTVYETVFVTVPPGAEETGAAGLEGESEGEAESESARRRRAERYMRSRRSRARRHGGVVV